MVVRRTSSNDKALLDEWHQAISEKEEVSRVIEELKEELKRFEQHREMVAEREAALRRSLAGRGVDPCAAQPEEEVLACEARGWETPQSGERKAESQSRAPLVFRVDSSGLSGALDSASGGASPTEQDWETDWEKGLAILNGVGAKDRHAKLRAHCFRTSTKSFQA